MNYGDYEATAARVFLKISPRKNVPTRSVNLKKSDARFQYLYHLYKGEF